MLTLLKKGIEKYNKVFIWNISSEDIWCTFVRFYNMIIEKEYDDIFIMYTICYNQKDRGLNNSNDRIMVKQISMSDYDNIMNIYYMYEFTNKVQIIAENSPYPSIWNYFKTGLMTEKQIFEVLLQ